MRRYQEQRPSLEEGTDLGDSKIDMPPSMSLIFVLAGFYTLSGVTQPLIMTLAKEVGIADPRAQLYMLFYYLGPALVTFAVPKWPTGPYIAKSALIAVFDSTAQAMNYTGSALAGPTIFAIIYSSVTVWTAVFSIFLLRCMLSLWQWLGVVIVFGGLCITGFSSHTLGSDVTHGALLIFFGSTMHALTYVMSEYIMAGDHVSVQANCAIQGIVASSFIMLWQLFYTRPHWEEVIREPMEKAGYSASWWPAVGILLSFTASNFVHAICFFHTLKHFPGGATSAGVMKALQAVLVFVLTSLAYCGRLGGPEMCFSDAKLMSLVVVVGGVLLFGKATEVTRRRTTESLNSNSGYEEIANGNDMSA